MLILIELLRSSKYTYDVGVSNTAGTLYYFIVMKNNVFIYCIIVVATILITKRVIEESSSPVEEMYHKQLVTTIDSILDARFGPDYCKENIDTINANTFSTCFSGIISPTE